MYSWRVMACSNSDEYLKNIAAAFNNNDNFILMDVVAPGKLVLTVAELHPDVVIWKVNVDSPVIPELRSMLEVWPRLYPILMLENPYQHNYLEYIVNGARGCLPARLLPGQVVMAVDLIINAGIISIPIPGVNITRMTGYGSCCSVFENLSYREHEIMVLLVNGLSNADIARNLKIAESTVKAHLTSIYSKLNVKSRTEAIALAYKVLNQVNL